MSGRQDDGYNVIDLENLDDPKSADDLIIEEEEDSPEPEPEAPEPEAPPPAAPEAEAGDDDEDEGEVAERRRLTRSQRLKAQRDKLAAELAEEKKKREALEARAQALEKDAIDGAAIGMDFYAKQMDAELKALRSDFDKAMDEGDRDKLWEVQQKIANLTAEKQAIMRERRAIPTKRDADGSGAEPQTRTTPTSPPQTESSTPTGKPHPLALKWYEKNKTWFGNDPIMTEAARVIDRQLTAEGYEASDPEFYEEFDKQMRENFPHKFKATEPPPRRQQPTIQNKGAVQVSGNKIRVKITREDREMADMLGLKIEDYARQKAAKERAMNTPNQYTEIL